MSNSDWLVKVTQEDYDKISEIAGHEGMTKKAVVHRAIERLYNVWVVS